MISYSIIIVLELIFADLERFQEICSEILENFDDHLLQANAWMFIFLETASFTIHNDIHLYDTDYKSLEFQGSTGH